MSEKPRFTEEELQARMAEIVELGVRLRGPSIAEELDEELELDGVDWQHAANDWHVWGRPKQLVVADPELPEWYPGPRSRWRIALLLGGRGIGKTKTGSETAWYRIETGAARLLIGATWRDVRRTMVGGLPNTTSGFLDVLPPWVRKETEWNKNNQEIYVHPYNATVYLATAEDPEQRGGNFDFVWGDEPIKWRRLQTVLDNLLLALRDPRGEPQMLLTTTPKPQAWLKAMIMDRRVLVIHGTTFENSSNLHPDAIEDWKRKYAGTRLGKQELDAGLLGDNDSAIASTTKIEAGRIEDEPKLVEVGVGVDPAVSTKRRSDESGIVAAGRTSDGHLVCLDDRTGAYEAADHGAVKGWSDEAVRCAIQWGADWIIYEENKIGNTGIALLRAAIERAQMTGKIGLRKAYSFKDKKTRSLALSSAYDREEVHHFGRQPELESQLTQWDPDDETQPSPNNVDAFVHVGNEVMGWTDTEPRIDQDDVHDGLADLNSLFAVDRSSL